MRAHERREMIDMRIGGGIRQTVGAHLLGKWLRRLYAIAR